MNPKFRHGLPITVGLVTILLGLKNMPTFIFINDLYRSNELWSYVINILDKSNWIGTYNFINGVIDFAIIVLGIVLVITTQRVPKTDLKN